MRPFLARCGARYVKRNRALVTARHPPPPLPLPALLQSHVCVLNTCLDLLRRDIPVYIVVDAISSQRPFDRAVGIERMKQVRRWGPPCYQCLQGG